MFFSETPFNLIFIGLPEVLNNNSACFVLDFDGYTFSVMFLILKNFMCIPCAFRILPRTEGVGSPGAVVDSHRLRSSARVPNAPNC